MKNHDINDLMPLGDQGKTLSECRRMTSRAAHSNGELEGVSRKKIAVQFVPLSEAVFDIKIRQAQRRPTPVGPPNSTVLLAAVRSALATMY